jgi:hypothetical protein
MWALSQRSQPPPRFSFPLFHVVQYLIEQLAEVGLDDIEFALDYGYNFGKIVDDLRARRICQRKPVLTFAMHTRMADIPALVVVGVNNPCCQSRAGFPPH